MAEVIEIRTRRLLLRQWRESDREPFALLNADPDVMEFFPSLQSREASNASIDGWQSQFALQGWSNWAVEVAESGQFAGLCRSIGSPSHPCLAHPASRSAGAWHAPSGV